MAVTTTAPANTINSSAAQPAGQWSLNYPTWRSAVATTLVENIRHGAGLPESWDVAKWGDPTQYAGAEGVPIPVYANFQNWLDSGAWRNSASDSQWLVNLFGQPPVPTAGDYIPTPEEEAKQVAREQWEKTYNLNVRQQDFAESKFMISLAVDNAARNAASSGGSRAGGLASDAIAAQAREEAIKWAQLELQEKLGMGQLEIDKLAQAADQAYKEGLIQAERDRLAQADRFHADEIGLERDRLALDTWRAGTERAATIAKMMSDPGDEVQQELMLRMGTEPTGTAVDPFSGQARPGGPVTLSQVMAQNAANHAAPIGTSVQSTTPPPPTPANTQPATTLPEAPVPAMHAGSDGFVNMGNKFISGDHPGNHPNPELVEIDWANREYRVTPLGQQPDAKMLPRFAYGTKPEDIEDNYWQQALGTGRKATGSGDPASDAEAYARQLQKAANRSTESKLGSAAYVQTGAYLGDTANDDKIVDDPYSPYYGMRFGDVKHVLYSGRVVPIYDSTGKLVPFKQSPSGLNGVLPDGTHPSLSAGNVPGYQPPAPPKTTNPTTSTPDPTRKQVGSFGATPIFEGSNRFKADQQIPYEAIGDPSTVQIFDRATGQWRPLKPGEVIPVGADLMVTMPTAPAQPIDQDPKANPGVPSEAGGIPTEAGTVEVPVSTPAQPEPSTPIQGTPPTEADPRPGVSTTGPVPSTLGPAVNDPTKGGNLTNSTVVVEPPDATGWGKVSAGGQVANPAFPDSHITLLGDGFEYRGPDGAYYRWNNITKLYEPIPWSMDPAKGVITNYSQWLQLPKQVQDAIIKGQQTPYVVMPEVFQQIAGGLPVGTNQPAAHVPPMSKEQFLQLPAKDQVDLIFGQSNRPEGFFATPGVLGGSEPGQNMWMGLPYANGFYTPGAATTTETAYDYASMFTDDEIKAIIDRYYTEVSGHPAPAPAPVTPPSVDRGMRGRLPTDWGNFWGNFPGGNNTPPPATTPPATTPPATTPPATTPPATTPPATTPPATTPPATTPPGGMNLPNGMSWEDLQRALFGDSGVSLISYGPDAYRQLPMLDLIKGGSLRDYMGIGTVGSEVPALGLTGEHALLAPADMNVGELIWMQQYAPRQYEFLKAIFKSANRDLDNEVARLAARAPLGRNVETSLVSTR